MARYEPDGRDGLDRLIATIVELFSTAEQRLTASLALQGRVGLEQGQGPDEALNLAELRRDAEQIARELRDAYPDEVARIADTAAEWGAEAALQEMSALAKVTDLTTTAGLPGSPAAQSMVADLTNALDDVTMRVLRYPDDVYRATIGQTAAAVPLGQATGVQVQQAAWNELLNQRVTGFTDAAGRRWSLASYVEMATRSATRRAFDDAKVAGMRENGVEFVTVVVGSGSCKNCAAWAGRILRVDDGPTGRIEVPSMLDPDETVSVRCAGTLEDAKRAGWRHPNCRCSTAAYVPGTTPVVDATTYDPEAEQARQRLRYLEREVRRSKLQAANALTDADRTAANARVRDLQSKIREHVSATGLQRQRRREQLNLGNRRT
ncbi:phage minor capsid protein [Demequina flava]|uniref:phage minor capsid protein n=1 Tax=Demequina flava TaxID=1095025 RepID=UPI000781B227|nr:phage minor capsid protein [Demequina flava]